MVIECQPRPECRFGVWKTWYHRQVSRFLWSLWNRLCRVFIICMKRAIYLIRMLQLFKKSSILSYSLRALEFISNLFLSNYCLRVIDFELVFVWGGLLGNFIPLWSNRSWDILVHMGSRINLFVVGLSCLSGKKSKVAMWINDIGITRLIIPIQYVEEEKLRY